MSFSSVASLAVTGWKSRVVKAINLVRAGRGGRCGFCFGGLLHLSIVLCRVKKGPVMLIFRGRWDLGTFLTDDLRVVW